MAAPDGLVALFWMPLLNTPHSHGRAPEISTIKRARAGATGAPFGPLEMSVPRCALILQIGEIARVLTCEATPGDAPYGAKFLNCAALVEKTTVEDTPPPNLKRADQGFALGLADLMTRKAEPLRAVGMPAGDACSRAKVLLAQENVLQRLQELFPTFFSGSAQQRVIIVHGATIVGTFHGKATHDPGTDVTRFTPGLAA